MKNDMPNAVAISAICAAILMGYVITVQNNTSRMAHALNADALELLAYGEPEQALLVLQEAVEADPDLPETHHYLGLGYSNNRDAAMSILGTDLPGVYEESLRHWEKAHTLSPENLKMAKSYAYLCLDAPQFGAQVDYDKASRAWLDYLECHTIISDNGMATYGILLRLARIEYERAGRNAARVYIDKARMYASETYTSSPRTTEEIEQFVFRAEVEPR